MTTRLAFSTALLALEFGGWVALASCQCWSTDTGETPVPPTSSACNEALER